MKIVPLTYQASARTKNIFLALYQKQPLAKEEFFSSLPARAQKILLDFGKKQFRGDEGEIKSLWLNEAMPERIVLFGMGEKEKWNERKEPLIARRMVQYAKREKISEFATRIFTPSLSPSSS